MDRGWLVVNEYTPSRPEELQVSVDMRQDERGHLQPVLVSNWTIQDDGSIRYLKATELHVLVTSTNQNLCVRYSFKDKLPMRSPTGEKWSFSANMVVLDPGHTYRVSVFNIPKPELGHSSYDVSTVVTVPDCHDSKMQMTEFCIERGSLWQPNISLAQISTVRGRSALAVSFTPDTLCEKYMVIVSCSTSQHVQRSYKANHSTLTVTFDLDKWPSSCCQFDVEVNLLKYSLLNRCYCIMFFYVFIWQCLYTFSVITFELHVRVNGFVRSRPGDTQGGPSLPHRRHAHPLSPPFPTRYAPDRHAGQVYGGLTLMTSAVNKMYRQFLITVKYKLMKQFEELYFRIVDIEKYQPGQVIHIEGIGGDEYFNCPSGRDLKNAIETFQKQCMDSEEEIRPEVNLLIGQLPILPVLQCVPLIRDGPPVYVHEVEITENGNSVHVLTPEVNLQHQLPSVEFTPVVNPECKHQYPSNINPHSPSPESVYIVEPVFNKSPSSRQNWHPTEEEPLGQIPSEDDEEDSLLPTSRLSSHLDFRNSVLQDSFNSVPPESSYATMRSEYFPPGEISQSLPVEMEDDEVEPSGKGPNSGSDQGYISKISSQHEPLFKEDPLLALARLQEELFEQNLRYSDTPSGPEGN
uniref:IL17RA/B N-terminal domain-containing protein n=1 Tax=Lates calcarifer TaxID=8187 RepID=A0A4W6FQL1_LATCA